MCLWRVWALGKNDLERLKLLYECALRVTIKVWSSSSKALLAEVSIKHAEKVRSEAQVDVDSFLVFARKVVLVAGVPIDKVDIKRIQKFDL